MKRLTANGSLVLDADFATHRGGGCERCARYDFARPATAAHCCLEGTVLLKRALLDAAPRRARAAGPRDEYRVSKAAAKSAMRYVE